MRATSYSGNVSAAMMLFQGDIVTISVDEHFAPQALAALKQFCESTNELYAEEARKAHAKELAQHRAELVRKVAEEEARLKVLQRLQLWNLKAPPGVARNGGACSDADGSLSWER